MNHRLSNWAGLAFSHRGTLILILAAGLFVFSQDLAIHGLEYRDDEIFYVKSTQEMTAEGNYLSPTYFGEDRFQKPILFYWLIIVAYHLLGTGWFAARFVSVVAATVTVCLTWLLARRLFDRRTADLSALVLVTMPMFFRHAKNAVPDMALNMFIVLGVYCAFRFFEEPERAGWRWGFFVSCALGFMIKGFAALVIPFVTVIVYAGLARKTDVLRRFRFGPGLAVFLGIVLPWFIYMAVVHGQRYVDYMLKKETLNRMVSAEVQHNAVMTLLVTFKNNFLFYCQTMMSYFAPWSIFILAAVPLIMFVLWRRQDSGERILPLVVWFASGFLFFSMIYARINHLILVLTTPLAIMLAYTLLYVPRTRTKLVTALLGLKNFFLIFFMLLGLGAVLFLRVYVLDSGWLWGALFGVVAAAALLVMIRRRHDRGIVPLTVAVVMVFIYAQAGILTKARLTTHAALQDVAKIVQADGPGHPIGVGSHDIHEKELQVYFDRYVNKLATSDAEQTRRRIAGFLEGPDHVYLVMTGGDYRSLLSPALRERLEMVKTDRTFRRRIDIDEGLFGAIARGDTKTVGRYLLEDILLLKEKEGN